MPVLYKYIEQVNQQIVILIYILNRNRLVMKIDSVADVIAWSLNSFLKTRLNS